MHSRRPPFRFNLVRLLDRFRALPLDVDASATIHLPGLTVTVRVDDVERRVARELVIRLADRRILNSSECCDGCIESALKSIQEIRALLVDKQVQLSHRTDSALYLLVEMMAEAIRQFLTFEQTLPEVAVGERNLRDSYFGRLEMLRAHFCRTLSQIAVVADVEIPHVVPAMRNDTSWDPDAYVLPPDPSTGQARRPCQ